MTVEEQRKLAAARDSIEKAVNEALKPGIVPSRDEMKANISAWLDSNGFEQWARCVEFDPATNVARVSVWKTPSTIDITFGFFTPEAK